MPKPDLQLIRPLDSLDAARAVNNHAAMCDDGDAMRGLLIAIGLSILCFWVPLAVVFVWWVS